jgi:3'(2'), 5'-bisphosphate nucleotidase
MGMKSTESEARLHDHDALSELFAELCVAAGAIIMKVFSAENIGARIKSDNSPVSDADEQAEAFLLTELSRRLPHLPLIAEESSSRGETPAQKGAFLLIDPLDGTREFIARRPEFTVNIGLIESETPRAGAVYAPALGELWFAGGKAFFARVAPGGPLPARESWLPLHTRRRPADGATALVSRSHLDAETEAFLAKQNIKETKDAGSSLKFCRLAQGVADIYPRFGPTMEWDTAAGDAVLRAAGGVVVTPAGGPFLYGKAAQNYRNGPFVAFGDPAAATLY